MEFPPIPRLSGVRGLVAAALAATAVLLAGCTDAKPEPIHQVYPPSTSPPAPSSSTAAPAPLVPPATTSPPPVPPPDPDDVRVRTAMAAVRPLAGEVGPRPARLRRTSGPRRGWSVG